MAEARFDESRNANDACGATHHRSGAILTEQEFKYRHGAPQLKASRPRFGQQSRKLHSIMVPIWIGALSVSLLFATLVAKLILDF